MTIWVLAQVFVNVVFLIGLTICLARVLKSKEDDPRLTQGLRLLQSKIAILEDLSDHSENQVKQLMTLLDKKLHEVRETIHQINQHIGEVDRSIAKSQKMAEIIQNEIPHDQILAKKIENKYVQAAQLAHQGFSVEEIVAQLDLPKAEVELIAKINRKKCVYDSDPRFNRNQGNLFSQSLEMPQLKEADTAATQLNFHKAIHEHEDQTGFRTVKLG